MAPVKLYYYAESAPCRLVLLTIRNLNLDAKIIMVDLMKKDQLASDFVKINPQHTVPTIDDNGFVLWESRAIASYLVSAKAPGNSLYPAEVQKKSVVDARLFLSQELQSALADMIYPIYTFGATEIPQDKKEKVYKILGNLNLFLEGKQYVAGNELTVADLAFVTTIASLCVTGANINKFSNVAAWFKRLESIPGYKENLEGAQALGILLKSRSNNKINLTTWVD